MKAVFPEQRVARRHPEAHLLRIDEDAAQGAGQFYLVDLVFLVECAHEGKRGHVHDALAHRFHVRVHFRREQQLHGRFGMLVAKRLAGLDEQVLYPGKFQEADGQRRGSSGERVAFLKHFVEVRHDDAGFLQEQASHGGERELAVPLCDERPAQLAFDGADMGSEGWLGQEQLVCGLRVVERLDERDEFLHERDVHDSSDGCKGGCRTGRRVGAYGPFGHVQPRRYRPAGQERPWDRFRVFALPFSPAACGTAAGPSAPKAPARRHRAPPGPPCRTRSCLRRWPTCP